VEDEMEMLCVLAADQTPTPSKFLRNCEEMGLFHELSKNPFEEAFKKASEDSSAVAAASRTSLELTSQEVGLSCLNAHLFRE